MLERDVIYLGKEKYWIFCVGCVKMTKENYYRIKTGHPANIMIEKGGGVKQKKMICSLQTAAWLALFLVFTGLNLLARSFEAFTNWYRLHVFPVWTGTLGRLSNLFSGSVGEVLIVIGVCYAIVGVLLLPVAVWHVVKYKKAGSVQKKRRAGGWYMRGLCWILLYVYGTETLNCYMLYHASTVETQYYDAAKDYGSQELVKAYTKVVERANSLAGQMQRDNNGYAIYGGSRQALYEQCKQAMQAQGRRYPYLSGYYPDPKPIRASGFMSQQHLLGIYFPFTMEANYNTVMYPVNVPATVCHEFAHLKGIILEDEANYFGFVACIESDDLYLQYSGYLSVLGYLARQVRSSVPQDVRRELAQPSAQVQADDVFLTDRQWEQVEQKAVLPTETVNQATDVFLETNLTMNGVEDGIQSYSRVVRLVVHYIMEEKGTPGQRAQERRFYNDAKRRAGKGAVSGRV